MNNAESGDINNGEERVRIVLCGIGGYGVQYVRTLRDGAVFRQCDLVAAVDPFARQSPEYPNLQAMGVPIFSELGEFFAQGKCDLVIVCSPIQWHCAHTCEALAHGAQVLCEKPLCSTREDADAMAQSERVFGGTVSIGYQWSFSQGIGQLKTDILQGKLGRPLRLKTLVCWPRNEGYYLRNDWAGRIRDSSGRVILDSPVNNATAHFLHNMLYIIGPTEEACAWPTSVEARLFRANAIENYDTAALEIQTNTGAKMEFFCSHATRDLIGPRFLYEFERGVVSYEDGEFQVRMNDGRIIHYRSPEIEPEPETKLRAAVKLAREGGSSRCGISAARAHTECVLLAQASESEITTFPESMITRIVEQGEPRLYVEGLQEALIECFETGAVRPWDRFIKTARGWSGSLAKAL